MKNYIVLSNVNGSNIGGFKVDEDMGETVEDEFKDFCTTMRIDPDKYNFVVDHKD